MKTLLTSILVVLLATLVAGPASADIVVNATFETGALPSDFGMPYATFGTAPAPPIAGGLWTQNLAAGAYTMWGDYGVGGSVVANSITGPVIHGYAELKVVTFSSYNDDQTLLVVGREADQVGAGNQYGFNLYYRPGNIGVYSTGFSSLGIPVANQDGAFHKYGWEVDQASRNLKVFFDDVQVGSLSGYFMTGNANGNVLYFGDGSGGAAHHSVWDTYVIAEGAYPAIPEPSSIVLLGLGVVGLLCYAWRKRK